MSQEVDQIRRVAINLLTRRDHSYLELVQKLKLKGFLKADIEVVLDELAASGALSEARFAESLIYWRKGRGFGPLRIKQELEAKGVGQQIIAEYLDITDNAWLEIVRKVWRKQFKERMPTDHNERARQMRFLQYRGFTRDQIESVYSRHDN